MKAARLLLVIVLAAAMGAILYWWYAPVPQAPPAEVAEPVSAPEKTPVPKIRHPLPEAAPEEGEGEKAEEPLPSLDESDPPLRQALADLLPERPLEDLLILRNIVGRVVLMVDALPRDSMPRGRLPVRPAPGDFLVEHGPDGPVVSPENDRRYAPYVRLIEAVDTDALISLYLRYYPLFQQVYEEMGYPDRYFNDRLMQVIDHLLETPDVEAPVRLVQPKVRYRYADPQLESLSAGRKILIRIGSENAAVLKGKLREIRDALIEAQMR
ncbi:MAG: DUF3014 domain-containing protein [Desulfuromonadales bacterium]|nr:DUF3014 domain-containing protein [Desulfuromonadales bacterium]NIS43711.1 DUF3014 domain-containing protein [Desulfuromonadales bacterium]